MALLSAGCCSQPGRVCSNAEGEQHTLFCNLASFLQGSCEQQQVAQLQQQQEQQQQQQQQQVPLLASASEVAAAQSYLRSQGNATRLLPALSTFQCLLSSPCFTQDYGRHGCDNQVAGTGYPQQQQQQQQQTEVVVPLSAGSDQLCMAKLLQIMDDAPAVISLDASVPEAAAAAEGSSSSAGVSLAIVDGVDVVQVKLFAGIQPPSESY
jgi:hypothetical protein